MGMMGGMDGGRRLFEQEVVKPKDTGTTLRRFGHYFRPYAWAVALVFIMIMVGTWTQVYAPKILGQMVDCYLFQIPPIAQAVAGESGMSNSCWFVAEDSNAIQTRVEADASIPAEQKTAAIQDAKIAGLGYMTLVLLGFFFAGAVLQGLSFFTMAWAGQGVLRDMRRNLFHHMTHLSLGYYSKNEAGDVMSRITSDTETIQQAFGFALLSVFSGIILIIWVCWEMIAANPVYGILSLITAPIMLAATYYFSNEARKAFRVTRKEMGSINADLQESIAGAREVQAFNREDENIEQFMATNAANRDANVKAAAYTSALRPVLEALGFVALAIVVVAGGYSLLQNAPLLGIGAVVTLGTVITFLQYVQRINQPLSQIAILWTNIQSAIAGGERIFNLLDETIDIKDKPDAKVMPKIVGNVEFRNARAEYDPGKPVLNGVSFEAKAGQTVAIVGPTGAGKTTIINLLPRFYDVTDGAVLIDGQDVRDVTLDSLRQQIGIVLQDSFLFSDTVMNNIRYGRLDATDEEVIAAAKMVAADAFIERLPEGYQTILGERGSGLSQGQRQLISIARAALLDPRILILDEATSSVDTRTERVIQAAFEKLLEGRTSFVIAHRLSTIRNADLLLVLKDGDIVERGTHNTLLEAKGAYYDLYMSQFRYEGEEAVEPASGD
jgi:ATP-binding cassette, subfamily B, multidrug efflux pump